MTDTNNISNKIIDLKNDLIEIIPQHLEKFKLLDIDEENDITALKLYVLTQTLFSSNYTSIFDNMLSQYEIKLNKREYRKVYYLVSNFLDYIKNN